MTADRGEGGGERVGQHDAGRNTGQGSEREKVVHSATTI